MSDRRYRLPRYNEYGEAVLTSDTAKYCNEWNALGRYAKELFGDNYVCTGFDPNVHFAEHIPVLDDPTKYRPGPSFVLPISVISRLNAMYEESLKDRAQYNE